MHSVCVHMSSSRVDTICIYTRCLSTLLWWVIVLFHVFNVFTILAWTRLVLILPCLLWLRDHYRLPPLGSMLTFYNMCRFRSSIIWQQFKNKLSSTYLTHFYNYLDSFAFMTSSGRLFHGYMTLCEKKYFRILFYSCICTVSVEC